MSAIIELRGIEVPGRHGVEGPLARREHTFGRHGVEEEERQREQPFLYDLELELLEPGADRIEETVDYREVVRLVREFSAGREFRLLEALLRLNAELGLEDGILERLALGLEDGALHVGWAGFQFNSGLAHGSVPFAFLLRQRDYMR